MKAMRWFKIKPVGIALMLALGVGFALPLCKKALPASIATAASSVFQLTIAIDEVLVLVLLVVFLALAVKWAATKISQRQRPPVVAFKHSSTPATR
jgi:hypothetical protein